jgi:hypothetical protein
MPAVVPARPLAEHVRNLDDHMLRAMAETDGIETIKEGNPLLGFLVNPFSGLGRLCSNRSGGIRYRVFLGTTRQDS